jgi:hypothetical protein
MTLLLLLLLFLLLLLLLLLLFDLSFIVDNNEWIYLSLNVWVRTNYDTLYFWYLLAATTRVFYEYWSVLFVKN